MSEHFISHSGPVNWPPRSCDLTPSDYFLWGHIIVHVYKDKLASIDALEDNIEAFFREKPAKMLERVCQNLSKEIDQKFRSRRGTQHKRREKISQTRMTTEAFYRRWYLPFWG